MSILNVIVIGLIAAVHVFIARFRFLSGETGNRWLSFSSGIAVAYIFIKMLPGVAEARIRFASTGGFQGLLTEYLFLVTLLGLIVYYGIDRLSSTIHAFPGEPQYSKREKINIMLHGWGYAFYNFLIGYLITNLPRPGVEPMILVTVVMVPHFLGLDYHFRKKEQLFYDRWLRWLFAASLVLGWVVGTQFEFPGFIKAVCFAFLSGAILINTIKEELPEDERASFISLLSGVMSFIVITAVLDVFFPKMH